MEEAEAWGVPQNGGHDNEHDDEHDDGHEFIGSPGQVFRNQLNAFSALYNSVTHNSKSDWQSKVVDTSQKVHDEIETQR